MLRGARCLWCQAVSLWSSEPALVGSVASVNRRAVFRVSASALDDDARRVRGACGKRFMQLIAGVGMGGVLDDQSACARWLRPKICAQPCSVISAECWKEVTGSAAVARSSSCRSSCQERSAITAWPPM